jgi:hypothetical protein
LNVSIGLLAGVSFIAICDQRSASALVVDVPGYGTWDIQVQISSFSDLDPPASSMPWWGDQAAANAFATASGPEFGSGVVNVGPFFAWGVSNNDVYMDAYCNGAPCFYLFGSADTAFSFVPSGPAGSPDTSTVNPWATATAVPSAAVPGPLPILGVAAALGYSRKLRKRIIRSKSYPVVSAID